MARGTVGYIALRREPTICEPNVSGEDEGEMDAARVIETMIRGAHFVENCDYSQVISETQVTTMMVFDITSEMAQNVRCAARL